MSEKAREGQILYAKARSFFRSLEQRQNNTLNAIEINQDEEHGNRNLEPSIIKRV